jgi:hypothetical protein
MWDTKPRRSQVRVPAEQLCSEIVGADEVPALVVDLGEAGLRLERPVVGPLRFGPVQLELDLPEYDDLIWAAGEVCFDRVLLRGGRVVRASGIRLVRAARRHLHALRDYVVERHRQLAYAGGVPDRRVEPRGSDWLLRRSGFRLG